MCGANELLFGSNNFRIPQYMNTCTQCYSFNYLYFPHRCWKKEPKGKNLRDETITIDEVDEAVKERIVRSDTALQSSSSNYKSKNLAGSKHSDFNTPKPHKAATQRFCLDDVFSI